MKIKERLNVINAEIKTLQDLLNITREENNSNDKLMVSLVRERDSIINQKEKYETLKNTLEPRKDINLVGKKMGKVFPSLNLETGKIYEKRASRLFILLSMLNLLVALALSPSVMAVVLSQLLIMMVSTAAYIISTDEINRFANVHTQEEIAKKIVELDEEISLVNVNIFCRENAMCGYSDMKDLLINRLEELEAEKRTMLDQLFSEDTLQAFIEQSSMDQYTSPDDDRAFTINKLNNRNDQE